MPDDRPILGEDLEPNPESEIGTRAVGETEPTKPPGGSGSAPRKRHPRAYRHEDDDEAFDAVDDGPVVVPDDVREGLYIEACNAAELAGFI